MLSQKPVQSPEFHIRRVVLRVEDADQRVEACEVDLCGGRRVGAALGDGEGFVDEVGEFGDADVDPDGRFGGAGGGLGLRESG